MLTKENVSYKEPPIYNSSVVAIESHPKDSRYQVISPETNQTIPSIMCHDAAHGGLIMEKRVFDSHRAHEFKEYTEVCESVLAHYGTGGAIHLWFWKTENLCCLKAHILTQQLMRTA